MLSLGIDIGGTNIALGIVTDDGRIECKRTILTPDTDACGIARIVFDTAKLLTSENNVVIETLKLIGVAVPGALDRSGDIVTEACNIGFINVPFRRILSEYFCNEIRLMNDADAAALAELNIGALRGVDTGLLITLGTGVGGCFVFNGRLFRGGLGRGTEIGHAMLDRNGAVCSCGERGCVETLCAASVLTKAAKRACVKREGLIYSMYQNGRVPDSKLLIECAIAGDNYALREFEIYTDALSDTLASVVNMIDPQIIAIGGGLSGAGEFLLEPLRKKTASKCFFGSCGKILAASAGNDAGIIGAVMPI